MSDVIVDEQRNSNACPWARNVVKAAGVTCRVCGEPTFQSTYCRHCARHRKIEGSADLVAPVVYAVGGGFSGRLLRSYKDHPLGATRARSAQLVGLFVEAALKCHTACIESVVGMPVSVRATLPSLTFRSGTHPFARIVRDVGIDTEDVLAVTPTATCHQSVRGDKFVVVDRSVVAGQHVLVIDDVWTTGSTAQSAALTLRRAGAAAISVMTVGRWINPEYPPTGCFLERHGGSGFDPAVCPVTGEACG